METTGNSFTGSYSYTLDAKGRVNIPAKMRKSLDPSSDSTFVATRSSDACVVLYPATVWKQVEAKLLALNKGKALNRHFTRNFVRHAEALQFDHQGRIALPQGLTEFAGIEKNVEIVGMIDRIELWNPDSLKEIESRLANRADELESIANDINF